MKVFRDILKGIFLVVGIWIMNAIIAFVFFSPTVLDTPKILITWAIADVGLLLLLTIPRFYTKTVILSSVGFIAILVGLYFVPITSSIPSSATELNELISEQNPDRLDYAELLFYKVEEKWTIPIRQYLLEPHKPFFIKSFAYHWNLPMGAYTDSNIQSQIYFQLLLESGRFTEDDVRIKNSFCTNSFHPYVIIVDNGDEIFADFFAVDNFEEYQFGQFAPYPCDELKN